MKYCVDCKNCNDYDCLLLYINPASGEKSKFTCYAARANDGFCGNNAKYFSEKEDNVIMNKLQNLKVLIIPCTDSMECKMGNLDFEVTRLKDYEEADLVITMTGKIIKSRYTSITKGD